MMPETIYEFLVRIINSMGTGNTIEVDNFKEMTLYLHDMKLFKETFEEIRSTGSITLEQISTLVKDCKIFTPGKIEMIDYIRKVIKILSINLTEEVDLFLKLQ